jgi:O-antigen ligase
MGAAFIFIYETALNTLFKFFYFGFSHGSFAARWEGIVACCKMFIKHPILGAGLGGVSTERFQEESTYDFKMITLQEFEAYDPTNSLTEVLASLGLVGLMAFIYLGIVFYRAFQDVIKNDAIDLSVKKTATALFLSLAVMIIALQMNQGLFRPYVWIHAAVVYGFLFRALPEQKRQGVNTNAKIM